MEFGQIRSRAHDGKSLAISGKSGEMYYSIWPDGMSGLMGFHGIKMCICHTMVHVRYIYLHFVDLI